MALHQVLTSNQLNMTGQLVITAPAPELAVLQDLAIELDARDNIVTDGILIQLPPVEQPPPPDGLD